MSQAMRVPDGHPYLLFALGVGAGVAVGILFGPKSGAATRDALAQNAQKGAEYLSSQGKQLASSTGDLVTKVKDFWQEHQEEVQKGVKLAARFYEEVVQPLSKAGMRTAS